MRTKDYFKDLTFWKAGAEFFDLGKRKWWSLTSEELILQTSSRHVFVYQEPVLLFAAVTDQLDKMRVPQLAQKNYFCLQSEEGKSSSSSTHSRKFNGGK